MTSTSLTPALTRCISMVFDAPTDSVPTYGTPFRVNRNTGIRPRSSSFPISDGMPTKTPAEMDSSITELVTRFPGRRGCWRWAQEFAKGWSVIVRSRAQIWFPRWVLFWDFPLLSPAEGRSPSFPSHVAESAQTGSLQQLSSRGGNTCSATHRLATAVALELRAESAK